MSAMDTDDDEPETTRPSGRRAATSDGRRATTSASCSASSTTSSGAQIAGAARRRRRAPRRADRDARPSARAATAGRRRRARRGLRVRPVDDQGRRRGPEEQIEFNVELRPSNFFDEARPWRPGEPPRPMVTSAWDVEGEALVMRVAAVSGRKYTIQETAAELEEQRFDTRRGRRRGIRQVRRRPGRAGAVARADGTSPRTVRRRRVRRRALRRRAAARVRLGSREPRRDARGERPRRARRGRRALGSGRR